MPEPVRLIVNADDFGQSSGINAGIVQAFEQGIVTSTSMMVRWPAAGEAAHYARGHAKLSVGLHFDIGEWAWRNGVWWPIYEVVRKDDREAISQELSRQLKAFHDLMGDKPSHLDSHQHVHRADPVRRIMVEKARELGIPLRLQSRVRYCGDFYGQTANGRPLPDCITLEAFDKLLSSLEPGVSELCCHPAMFVDFDTMYTGERIDELNVLCDQRTRHLIDQRDIELCSFNNVLEDSWA